MAVAPSTTSNALRADVLIIGSGIAGLRAAADLIGHGRIVILTKADPTESNTGYAQGGIAAAVGVDDTPEEHFADTIAAGDGLCEEAAARVLVEDGVHFVNQLIDWGARFDRDRTGAVALGREGAHRVRRVLHARDATGREIGRLLWSRVANGSGITVMHDTRAIALDVRDGRCVGARYANRVGVGTLEAPVTLLATGGAGQVFRETTNPPIATGDGVALAWRAGARVVDLEFVQFHPTALAIDGVPRFLLSEALRGEGAHLLNADEERFMTNYERAGELASRDLVSRAIVREMRRTGAPVYLSMRHLDREWVHARFPTISAACQSAGLDLASDLIPVQPAAHYMMGGVETDIWARTTLPGLYAAGEVACTGVHGANRLASNSLLEGLVFGARAAAAMMRAEGPGEMSNVRETSNPVSEPIDHPLTTPGERVSEAQVRRLLWDAAGLWREGPELEAVVPRLAAWERHFEQRAIAAPHDESLWRASSIATVGWLIAKAALRRQESRGAHYRTDFPARDDVHWRFHVAERKAHI